MFNKKKKYNNEINPDEIFLDSKNLPNFNTHQFEGRIEKPISKGALIFLGVFFLVVTVLFAGKLTSLQVLSGSDYQKLSENNRLQQIPLFSLRGVIFDKNRIELAWNTSFESEEKFSKRVYTNLAGFGHLLGYVSYPKRDSSGYYYTEDFEGKDGVEFVYKNELSGSNGVKIVETNALSEVQSESTAYRTVDGKNIILTIDSRIQTKFFEIIKDLSDTVGFNAGAGVIMDINDGSVLSITSYPEYDPNVLTAGKNKKLIDSYINDDRNPFLNRAVSGLYAPGSIIKPILAIAALNEGVIDSTKKILSTGSISIPNIYFPGEESIFKDWKAHGWVDLKDALAVSSNVYFYEIGGGYKNQKGVGIEKIEAYMKLFGISKKTGIDLVGEREGLIPTPKWKEETFNDEWRIGDTYNTSIGQYGFQITLIQAVRAIAGIANNGFLVLPHVVSSIEDNNAEILEVTWKYKNDKNKIGYVKEKYFGVVKEGLRQAVTSGTAQGLNIKSVNIAAKTGTAEIGVSKKRVNSWVIGFFPYENPKYAFAVVMERGPVDNLIGGLFVMRQMFDWMAINTPEYLSNTK